MIITQLRQFVFPPILGACLLMFGAFAWADDHDDGLDALDGRTPEQLEVLRDNIDEVIETAAFYSAFGALLALLAIGALIQRQINWSAYAGLTLLALIWNMFFEQNLGGLYWSGFALDRDQVVAFGFALALLNAGVAATLAPPRLRVLILASAALIVLIWLLHGLMPPPLDTFVFALTLIGAAGLHLLPVSKVRGFVLRLNTKWYLLVGGGVLVLWAGVVLTELDEEADPIFLNRAVVGLLTSAFIALFLVRTLQIIRDRDAAVQKSLADARKEAETSRALFETEKRYTDARALAQERSRRLATASHDIRQPIAALRSTMASVMGNEAPAAREQMDAAFTYLGQLADEYITEGKAEGASDPALDERLNATEQLSADLLGSTVDRMFRKEAEDKGLSFLVALGPGALAADPLKLMRAVSNLTANAIAHTTAGAVELNGQSTDGGYLLSVRNTAEMAGDPAALMAPFTKGEASGGSGLGLSIVRDLADSAAFEFSVAPAVAGETTMTLRIPTSP